MKRTGRELFAGVLMLAAAGTAGAYTEYTWRGVLNTDWANAGNWQAPNGMLPAGGTTDSRLSVYNGGGSPLYHTAAQGDTVLAPTGAGAPRAIVVGSTATGALFITGGKLEWRGAQPDVIGNGSIPGTVVVDGGTLVKTNGNELFLGLGGAGGWGALFVSNGTATIRSITNNASGGTITLAGGTLELGRFRRSATHTNYFNGGTLVATTNESSWIHSGTVNLLGENGLTADTAGYDVVLMSSLSSNGPTAGLVKKGTGILTLQAANTYAGPTRVEAGLLALRDDNALAGTSGIVVSNNATLAVGNGVTVGAGKTATLFGRYLGDNSGTLRIRDGSGTWAGNVLLAVDDARIGASGGATALTIGGALDDGASTFGIEFRPVDASSEVILSGASTYGGATTVVVGGLRIAGADDRLPVGTLLEIGNGSDVSSARFDLNGFNQRVGGLVGLGNTMPLLLTNSSATPATLTVNQASTRTYRGLIGGALGLVKTNTGILNLTGANTHTGDTTVNGGTLRINNATGSGTGTGNVTVNNGGTLGGTGTIAGAVTVNAGGKLAAGNSVGTNTVGSLTLTAGSTFEVEANGAAVDQTISLGPVDLGGATLSTVALGAPTFTSAIILSNATGQITGLFAGLYEADQVLIGVTPYYIHYRPTYVELNLTPTAVVLHQFGAIAEAAGVVVRWRTASEVRTAGFDVYRKAGGEWVKVNDAQIAATGAPQGGIGASYAVVDAGAVAGGTYEYKLVETEQDGTKREYGPYERTASAFEMTSPIRATPEGMEIRWLSRAGERYRVLRASELRKPSFEVVAEALEATPPENVFVDTHAAPLRVYRVELDE